MSNQTACVTCVLCMWRIVLLIWHCVKIKHHTVLVYKITEDPISQRPLCLSELIVQWMHDIDFLTNIMYLYYNKIGYACQTTYPKGLWHLMLWNIISRRVCYMLIEVVKKELTEDDTWYNDTFICFVNVSDCQSENIYCLTVSYEKLVFGDVIKTSYSEL